MSRTEVRVTGFGGQGVILSGRIMGMAAAIYDEKYATMTQSFGPEARGSSCSAQLVVSDEPIRYPYIQSPDILVSMSQAAYTKYVPQLREGGMLILEEDLIDAGDLDRDLQIYKIPATRLAEELGRKIVLNIIMIGFFTSVAGIISKDAMSDAITHSVPVGTEKLNLKAFQIGYDYGLKQLK